MLADPATVTINSVAKNLVRIRHDQYSSEYRLRSAVDEIRLNVRNSAFLDKRLKADFDRHNVELIWDVFPTSPGGPAYQRKAYISFLNQKGDTLTDPKNLVLGLVGFLTDATITKLMNSES